LLQDAGWISPGKGGINQPMSKQILLLEQDLAGNSWPEPHPSCPNNSQVTGWVYYWYWYWCGTGTVATVLFVVPAGKVSGIRMIEFYGYLLISFHITFLSPNSAALALFLAAGMLDLSASSWVE
jgi:hypothetical protein